MCKSVDESKALHRINELEKYSDQYKKILDISTNEHFFNLAKQKDYDIYRYDDTDINNKKQKFEYISIYQYSLETKFDIKNILTILLDDEYSKEIIIRIESIYDTLFGVSSEKLLNILNSFSNLKIINLVSKYKEKDNKTNHINLIIRKIDHTKEPILNVRVGDTIKIGIDKIRIGWFHALDNNCIHPYYLAAKLYIETNNREKVFELFEEFRKNYLINSVDELFGIERFYIFKNNYNIFESLLPWENIDISTRGKSRHENIKNENLTNGINSYEYFGDKNCTLNKSKVEVKRICNLVDNIRKEGFKTNNIEQITATILIKNDEWSCFINGGNHRVAVLSALGYNPISLQIYEIVDLSNIEKWKYVKNGLYSKKSAEFIFDNIFNAQIPSSFNNWKEKIIKKE